MLIHKVESGECIASIAKRYGFPLWSKIYDAPENADLKKRRPNPNVLYPGDEIVIPEKVLKQESVSTDATHRFKVKSSTWMFRIVMKDDNDHPYEGYPFQLYVDRVLILEGETQAGGVIEAPVSADDRSGVLHFLGEEIELRLGQLDPITRIKGIQQRLNNLGYYAGPEDGKVGEKTIKAVYAFQQAYEDLENTGEINDAFRQRLLKVHDADEDAKPTEENMSSQD